VALGAVVATYFLPYSKDFYSEPLATLFVVVSIQQTLAGRTGWSRVVTGGAAITRPQTIALVPVVLGFVWRDQSVRALLQTAALAASGVVIEAWYNFARFGDVLQFNPLQGGLDFGSGWGARSAGNADLGRRPLLRVLAGNPLVGAEAITSASDPDRFTREQARDGCLGWSLEMTELG